MPWIRILALAMLGLGACAPEVVRRPTELFPVSQGAGITIQVLKDTPIIVGPGYRRVIAQGSVWALVGRSREGEIFKPVDRVFTVEGAQIHEAYLVLDEDRVVGFYLPVERAFSPASTNSDTRLPFQRR